MRNKFTKNNPFCTKRYREEFTTEEKELAKEKEKSIQRSQRVWFHRKSDNASVCGGERFHIQEVRFLKDNLPVIEGQRLLDLASGPGRLQE